MKIIYETEKSLSGGDILKTIQKIVKLERELQDWRDLYTETD